jgi:hypothetical protein
MPPFYVTNRDFDLMHQSGDLLCASFAKALLPEPSVNPALASGFAAASRTFTLRPSQLMGAQPIKLFGPKSGDLVCRPIRL